MLDPSKPMPSSKISSLSSETDVEKCCHTPGRSMKRRSTIFTPLSRANSTTSFGFMRQPPRMGQFVAGEEYHCWLALIMTRVLIVGGGFAGFNAAKIFGKAGGVDVTLIDRRNYHLFQPLLYQVA